MFFTKRNQIRQLKKELEELTTENEQLKEINSKLTTELYMVNGFVSEETKLVQDFQETSADSIRRIEQKVADLDKIIEDL